MEGYIGERVLVTLRDPPDTQVNGLVTQIIGQELCLRDGELYLVEGRLILMLHCSNMAPFWEPYGDLRG